MTYPISDLNGWAGYDDQPSEDYMAKKPLFQKRHYEAIAEVLNDIASSDAWTETEAHEETIGIITLKLANMLQSDNPKFDRERFLKAVYK